MKLLTGSQFGSRAAWLVMFKIWVNMSILLSCFIQILGYKSTLESWIFLQLRLRTRQNSAVGLLWKVLSKVRPILLSFHPWCQSFSPTLHFPKAIPFNWQNKRVLENSFSTDMSQTFPKFIEVWSSKLHVILYWLLLCKDRVDNWDTWKIQSS